MALDPARAVSVWGSNPTRPCALSLTLTRLAVVCVCFVCVCVFFGGGALCVARVQDGCLLDALVLWKQNLDKEFEGCEPCPICFAVICSANHQLPRLACSTCRNKYHGPCLQKWFRTSGKSNCPMCTTPWKS